MDSQALVSVFPKHRNRLVAVLARLVGADEAEDLSNETLLKAMDAIEGFREESTLGTWLHRIAVKLAYDHLRRQGRQPIETPIPISCRRKRRIAPTRLSSTR